MYASAQGSYTSCVTNNEELCLYAGIASTHILVNSTETDCIAAPLTTISLNDSLYRDAVCTHADTDDVSGNSRRASCFGVIRISSRRVATRSTFAQFWKLRIPVTRVAPRMRRLCFWTHADTDDASGNSQWACSAWVGPARIQTSISDKNSYLDCRACAVFAFCGAHKFAPCMYN